MTHYQMVETENSKVNPNVAKVAGAVGMGAFRLAIFVGSLIEGTPKQVKDSFDKAKNYKL